MTGAVQLSDVVGSVQVTTCPQVPGAAETMNPVGSPTRSGASSSVTVTLKVVVVAFPALSTQEDRRHALTRSLALLAVLGAAVTAGVWLLPGLALVFIGGAEFAEIADRLWLFAVIGMLLSALQLLVYAVLARRGQRSAYLLWAGLVALVVLGLGVDTLDALIAVVMAVDGVLLALLLVISLVLVRSPAPAQEPAPLP